MILFMLYLILYKRLINKRKNSYKYANCSIKFECNVYCNFKWLLRRSIPARQLRRYDLVILIGVFRALSIICDAYSLVRKYGDEQSANSRLDSDSQE